MTTVLTEPKTGSAESSVLLRIMYSSVMPLALDETELNQLLVQSAANNQRDGITGVLMVDRTLYIQYFEGPEAAVKALWSRISADKRHHLIVQLYEENGMLKRLFGQWAMLRGKASRAEMLSLIRNADVQSDTVPRPAWSLAIAPLVILLDAQYNEAYAKATL
jgi:Sensors of blue-light using FAD